MKLSIDEEFIVNICDCPYYYLLKSTTLTLHSVRPYTRVMEGLYVYRPLHARVSKKEKQFGQIIGNRPYITKEILLNANNVVLKNKK